MIVKAAVATLLAGLCCAAQPAAARHATLGVAAARIGLITTRTPRMGPQLVRRGGYTAITDMVRPRFVGGMIDIYPDARSGFRLSLGNRYFGRPNFWSTAEQATRGLLFDPRMTRGAIGSGGGFRRKTAAITAGYDLELIPGLVAGLEGGALNGRAISGGLRGRSFRTGGGGPGHAGLNPVASFTLRYAF